MKRALHAWGWWLAGAATVLLGMYLFTRRFYGATLVDDTDDGELDDGGA